MARTAQQIVEAELGGMYMQVCTQTAEIERLRDENAALKAKLNKYEPVPGEPVRNPDNKPGKPEIVVVPKKEPEVVALDEDRDGKAVQ